MINAGHHVYAVHDAVLDREQILVALTWQDALDMYAQRYELDDYQQWLDVGNKPLSVRDMYGRLCDVQAQTN